VLQFAAASAGVEIGIDGVNYDPIVSGMSSTPALMPRWKRNTEALRGLRGTDSNPLEGLLQLGQEVDAVLEPFGGPFERLVAQPQNVEVDLSPRYQFLAREGTLCGSRGCRRCNKPCATQAGRTERAAVAASAVSGDVCKACARLHCCTNSQRSEKLNAFPLAACREVGGRTP
jgi:hypothetical protein